ncbi:phosphoenolpyruvate-utilizing protein [Rhodococcus pseudokoreensis]|uniref:Phosphoenolpyruvate-utilizing protein n=1 Tax=Rhodococcus pseudokoreensis TaxID=2811421 RepID=A0A974W7L4_9NOCA|nr:PEP-utilizing enzyme [Rhodococcus pseudokoreensis]QSE92090.1 phosphoenolpyruvate-utilizing protein [Rhodococcus pseudokoreensis]
MTSTLPTFDPVRGASDPDRFWSTTNTAEATPRILTPLCWSVWGAGLESAWLRSMGDFGVLSRHEQMMSADMNQRSTAAIYGRQAVNVDVLRAVLARLPGVKPDDVERDLLGSVRDGLEPEASAPRRIPVIMTKLPVALLRLESRFSKMYRDQAGWWRREVYMGSTDSGAAGQPIEMLRKASHRFGEAMYIHSQVRFLIPAAEGSVNNAAARSGVPDLAARALRGYGNVAETQMADALWEVANGTGSLESFIETYGFHGPYEGNVYTRSWREDDAPLRNLIKSYRNRPELVRPTDRESHSITERISAEKELLAALPPIRRQSVLFMLRRAAGLTRKLELTKAAYLMALDGCRAAARALGSDLVARGRLSDCDDVFFLTIDELDEVLNDTSRDVRGVISFRKAERRKYEQITLPVAFTGMPPEDTGFAAAGPATPTSLIGKASGGGVVAGTARVVTDLNDDVDLGSSDILVCRFTDPSWTPMMALASALVVDIGSQSSHGAVVARELGITYVIGTDIGTKVIHDGDHLVVDGVTGTVTVDRARRATDSPRAGD